MKKKNPSIETSDNEAYKFLATGWNPYIGKIGKVFRKDLRLVFDQKSIARAIRNTSLGGWSQEPSSARNFWSHKKNIPEFVAVSHLEINGHLEIGDHKTDEQQFNGIPVTIELYGYSPKVPHKWEGCGTGNLEKFKTGHSIWMRIDGDAFFWKVLNDKLDNFVNSPFENNVLKCDVNVFNVKAYESSSIVEESAGFKIASFDIRSSF